MTQSIVCSACGATVTYGRLSCQECGELLASVAGAHRTPDVLHDPQPPEAEATSPAMAARVDALEAPAPIDVGAARWAADDDGFEALLAESATAASAPSRPATTPPPGAYLPPDPAPLAATTMDASSAGALAAPARSWGGPPAGAVRSDPPPPPAAADPLAAPVASDEAASLLSGERAGEFVGWLAVAGAALALVGMILPWSSLTVIGAAGVGYFDRWGIAGPGHLLVLLATAGVLALAILRDRVPAWLGIGLPGLALGGLLVGLTWPYLIGPLGGQLGSWAVALGGVLLIAAGVAAIVVDRHGAADRGV